MDEFLRLADQLVIYKLRTAWLQISKLYNEMAADHDTTMSMAFVLLAINEGEGTPVTRIAPRMGMEPNSLSRILKSMEENGLVCRKKDEVDKRMAYVCLTETGVEKRKVAMKAVYRLQKAIAKQINEEKMSSFFDVLNHIPVAIEEFKEESA